MKDSEWVECRVLMERIEALCDEENAKSGAGWCDFEITVLPQSQVDQWNASKWSDTPWGRYNVFAFQRGAGKGRCKGGATLLEALRNAYAIHEAAHASP